LSCLDYYFPGLLLAGDFGGNTRTRASVHQFKWLLKNKQSLKSGTWLVCYFSDHQNPPLLLFYLPQDKHPSIKRAQYSVEMSSGSCSECGQNFQDKELRPITGFHLSEKRVSSKCRWAIEHTCRVKGCKTPKSKVKLLPLPVRLSQSTQVVQQSILAKFEMSVLTKYCCKSCYNKLHAATREFRSPSDEEHSREHAGKKGRPCVSYNDACRKTQTKIEKKAANAFLESMVTLKETISNISGDCGEELFNVTMGKMNETPDKVIKGGLIEPDNNLIDAQCFWFALLCTRFITYSYNNNYYY